MKVDRPIVRILAATVLPSYFVLAVAVSEIVITSANCDFRETLFTTQAETPRIVTESTSSTSPQISVVDCDAVWLSCDAESQSAASEKVGQTSALALADWLNGELDGLVGSPQVERARDFAKALASDKSLDVVERLPPRRYVHVEEDGSVVMYFRGQRGFAGIAFETDGTSWHLGTAAETGGVIASGQVPSWTAIAPIFATWELHV